VIFVDQPFDVNAAQHKLLSIDGGKSRFSWHAVVAHIRSLPALTNFAMASLGREKQFLHSFQTERIPIFLFEGIRKRGTSRLEAVKKLFFVVREFA